MRMCLIFNPTAGASERLKDFLLHLKPEHRCEVRATAPGHGARQIAREAVDEGFDRIIAAGGDGTISQVVNGIAPDFERVELALLPFGTGNDLARALGARTDQPSNTYAAVLGRDTSAIDVIRITSKSEVSYCVNVANGGLAGHAAKDIQAIDKQRWGAFAYWFASVSSMLVPTSFQLHINLDDSERRLEGLGLAIANGRFVGGGFPIAPGAVLNDGLLDVTAIPALPALELMTAGLNHALGREDRADRIRRYRARRVEVTATPSMPFSIDGELSQRLSARFEALPRALRMVTFAEPIGLGKRSAVQSLLGAPLRGSGSGIL